MNTNRIFSRRTKGMDTRVWRVMFIVIIISIGLLASKITEKDECVSFKIDVRRNSFADSFFYTGDDIRFVASIPSQDMSWDFNDNSVSSKKGSFVTHTFAKEAKYFVTASISPTCEEHIWITVKNKPPEVNTTAAPVVREIFGPTSTQVGKTEEFISPALADSSYDWVVLYHPEMGSQHGEKAKFQFANGKSYDIQLTLDHDRIKTYTKRLYVEDLQKPKLKKTDEIAILIPKNETVRPEKPEVAPVTPPDNKPETPAEPTHTIKRISEDLFKSYLEQVVLGQKTAKDFEKYGVFGNTPVIVNGNKKQQRDFNWLCQELMKKKGWLLHKSGVTLESVQLQRINDAITLVDVKCHW